MASGFLRRKFIEREEKASSEDKLEAWIGSGDKDCVQLSWISLSGTKKEIQKQRRQYHYQYGFRKVSVHFQEKLLYNRIIGCGHGKTRRFGYFRNQTEDAADMARVTSLALQNSKILWVGTGGGHVILLDGASLKPLITTQRYTSSVRCITVTRPAETLKPSAVLTGDLGFRSRSMFDIAKEDQFGCLALWDGDLANQIKTSREELKKRQELIDKYSNSS